MFIEKPNRKALKLDRYHCFAELTQYETFGEDYCVDMKKGSSGIAVMAPHGGGIEFGTNQMARAIAHPDHTFWTFKGIKKTGNRILHITSTRFDAPDALKIARAAQTVITLHGCHGDRPLVYVGGRHDPLKDRLCRDLLKAGFNARISKKEGLRGESPLNLCNRCKTGNGVQLEITTGLRKRMFTPTKERSIKKKTEHFLRFTSGVRTALMP
ncbi:MAG: poly-gamma-glutamate hydrolase family protein [Deltaproteobacteria bacterium]|nr:poly-gamma-glutamate hydrolase family protein [Deltaproteobacteria bacterium]